MLELLDGLSAWPLLIAAMVIFGFAPKLVLRVILLAFHPKNPRRRELLAELEAVPRWERPFWVAEQLEVALVEGLPDRIKRAKRAKRAKFQSERVDVVSSLDSQPDLMQIGDTEFEHLVRQIFEAMGTEAWTTQQSIDDSVDAVVVNRSPLVGGLSIVQAKRCRNGVGVNHIRELAGAMEEKKRPATAFSSPPPGSLRDAGRRPAITAGSNSSTATASHT